MRHRGDVPPVNGVRLRVRETTFVGATFKIRASSEGGQTLDIDVSRKELGDEVLGPGDEIIAEWGASALAMLRKSPQVEGVS